MFRWLASRFLSDEDQEKIGVNRREDVVDAAGETSDAPPVASPAPVNGAGNARPDDNVTFRLQEDAPPCHECGAIMVRGGACYKCLNCGATSGCS
jgi:ribonucleoside-diphosphate reductase alpha chain